MNAKFVFTLFFVLLICIISCKQPYKQNHTDVSKNIANDDFTQQKNNKDSIKSLYDYNQIIKQQDSLLKDFTWPRKIEIDLNDDGIDEVFLAVEGYSRGMDYVLFTKMDNKWTLLTGDQTVPASHLEIEKLKNTNGKWHDFVARQPSGRDGLIESFYWWNGQKYIQTDQKETSF